MAFGVGRCCTATLHGSEPAAENDEEQEGAAWSFLKTLLGRHRPPEAELPKYWTRSGSKESSSGSREPRSGSKEARKGSKESVAGSEASASEDDNFRPIAQADKKLVEALMNRTSKEPESEFRLVRAVRVESPELWQRYQDCATRVRRRRGSCGFAGRGAPLTQRELRGVQLSDGFPSELDETICEAYLWHATKPRTAARILREGFKVSQRSAFGERFGQGSYFSEDAAKADAYASAGEGLYKDCYAMLLCRVVLGRQYRTDKFRQEDAAEQAAGRYDSILAEPRGASFREFVAFEDAQAYPEFALVYERQPAEGDASPEHRLQRSLSPDLPMYWRAARKATGFFHSVQPDHAAESCIQSLVDLTWVHAFTWERRDGNDRMIFQDDPNHDMPEGLTVLKVLRLEDSELWQRFRTTREEIRSSRSAEQAQSAAELGVRTHRPDLPLHARAGLDKSAGEVYLWHGCSPQVAMSILKDGFPEEPTSGGAPKGAAMFGKGFYFTDSAAKADEHSEDDKEGFYSGYYAMLLCRAVLGRVNVLKNADLRAHLRVGRGLEYDSIVGFQEASNGSFREYVVPDRCQIYPEYAIVYERMYDTPRVR